MTMLSKIAGFFNKKYIAYPLFWGYNLIYLGFILLTSNLFFILLTSNSPISIPWNVALMVYILIFTPIISSVIGALKSFRTNTEKLNQLLFGVELPIVILALIRLIFIREMTPVFWLFFLGISISIIGFLLIVFDFKPKSNLKFIALLFSQEVSVVIAAYFGVLTAFFMPIILVSFIKFLISINYLAFFAGLITAIISTAGLALLYSVLFFIFMFLLFVFTVGFFIVTPIVCIFMYSGSFFTKFKELKERLNLKKARIISYSFAVVFIALGVVLSIQPDSSWYEGKPVQELLKNQDKLRTTLVNNYLARYRYLGDNRIDFIKEGYINVLGLNKSFADTAQKAFTVVALPFIYQGNFVKDAESAGEKYEEIFDANIQDGERKIILKALKTTNTRDEIKAGLLDKDKKTVKRISKKITTEADKDSLIAKVSIQEEYENTTSEIQEVYYEFYLPEGAVITSLKLGPNLEYEGVISPKGAARKTYENQVRRRIDPALLEQTGPRQYRMRVFPIPTDKSKQKIKFEYLTYIDPETGEVPLPVITQERNVFSKEQSRNIKPVKVETKGLNTELAQYSKIDSGYVYFVPHKKSTFNLNDIKGLKIAFLLDKSYSSKDISWGNYIKSNLPIIDLIKNNQMDLYFFSDELGQRIKLRSPKQIRRFELYGKTHRLNALQAIPDNYDVVLMFTDSSDFDSHIKPEKSKPFEFPVYLIHANGNIPQYIDDLTINVIKSGGKSVTTPIQAFKHFSLSQNANILDVNDYGTWFYSKTLPDKAIKAAPESYFNTMAANMYIKSLIKEQDTSDIQVLDNIHSLAKEFSAVTPYSSLIALVNDRQKQALKEAEAKDDRFRADYDIGAESLESPSGEGLLNVGSVPEPEEWLLIFLVFAILLAYLNKKRIQCLFTS